MPYITLDIGHCFLKYYINILTIVYDIQYNMVGDIYGNFNQEF